MWLVTGRAIPERRPLTAAGDSDAAASGPTARRTDVLNNRRLQNHRVGSCVRRCRTDSAADAQRSEGDAVMMLMLGAFHVHLEPNISSCPLSVVIQTGLYKLLQENR